MTTNYFRFRIFRGILFVCKIAIFVHLCLLSESKLLADESAFPGYSVRDYGAKGDGQTNDTAAFRKAFAAGKKDLHIPAGTYLVGPEKIEIPENVFLHGTGAASVLKLAKDTQIILQLSNGCRISMFSIFGKEAKQGGVTDAVIYLPASANGCVIDSIRIFDCDRACIVTDHANDLLVRDCDFRNIGMATNLQFSNRIKVLNNTVINARLHGLQLWGNWENTIQSEDIIFANNYVKNGGGGAIWGTGARRVIMIGNIVDTCYDVGLDLEMCEDSVIAGNTVTDCETAGISLFYSCKNVSITGNTIVVPDGKRGRRDGIWLTPTNLAQFPKDFGHENIAISGNTITSVGKSKHGIAIGSGSNMVSAGNVLSNCDIHDATGNLIVLDDRATRTSQSAPEDTFTVIPLNQEWHFAIDPKDAGVKEKWFAPGFNDDKWAKIRSDKDCGWEAQGFGGDDGKGYTGFAWYRVELPKMPDKMRTFAYLFFEMADEQAWVYLNSELIGEHTEKSEDREISVIWSEPFFIDIAKYLRPEQNNILAVRIHNSALNGGLQKPVFIVLSDRPVGMAEQFRAIQEFKKEK